MTTGVFITRDCPQSEHQVTNFFGHCELQREQCGEVLVTNFRTIFPGENRQDNFATEKSTTDLALKNFKFHHRVLLGPLLHKCSTNLGQKNFVLSWKFSIDLVRLQNHLEDYWSRTHLTSQGVQLPGAEVSGKNRELQKS